jgi:replicative DNA helicase
MVDQITLPKETLNALGGDVGVMDLVNNTPSMVVSKATSYAAIIHEKAEQRRMLRAADFLAKAAWEDDTETRRDLASKARKRLRQVEANWRIDGGEAPLELLTADTILTTDWPEPVWTVPGILTVGLALVAGLPRSASPGWRYK